MPLDQQSQPAMPTCDIVMKGGITSGVVYPLALVELAKTYRFSNIGGTSARAIAAAAAGELAGRRRAPASSGWRRSPLRSVPICFPCFSRCRP